MIIVLFICLYCIFRLDFILISLNFEIILRNEYVSFINKFEYELIDGLFKINIYWYGEMIGRYYVMIILWLDR